MHTVLEVPYLEKDRARQAFQKVGIQLFWHRAMKAWVIELSEKEVIDRIRQYAKANSGDQDLQLCMGYSDEQFEVFKRNKEEEIIHSVTRYLRTRVMPKMML